MKTAKFAGLLMAVLFLTTVGIYAQSTPPAAGPAGQSLYQRLGEAPGVAHLVDTWAFKVMSDKRVAHYFKAGGKEGFSKCMTACVTAMTGGPKPKCCAHCTKGKDAKACGKDAPKDKKCHACGMNAPKMTAADFNALMEDLGWAADKIAVGKWQKEQLMAKMHGMRKMCVNEKGAAAPAPAAKKAPKHGKM